MGGVGIIGVGVGVGVQDNGYRHRVQAARSYYCCCFLNVESSTKPDELQWNAIPEILLKHRKVCNWLSQWEPPTILTKNVFGPHRTTEAVNLLPQLQGTLESVPGCGP